MKPQDVSRQTHAQESHDDGRNGTMSYVTGRGNSGLRISFFPSREWSLWGSATRKPPALPGDGYSSIWKCILRRPCLAAA